MGYLRFLWTALTVVVVLILCTPFLLVGFVIGWFNMELRERYAVRCMHVAFRIWLFAAGTRVHLEGLENIPKDQPVLYIGNHRGFFDVVVSYVYVPGRTCYIAKKEFKKVPFLSWWMMLLNDLFIDRNDIKQGLKVILQAIEYVKRGMNICIFPEGTRNKTEEEMLPFHEGSFKIATKTDCAIVPMTMYNMEQVFEAHFPKIESTDVYVRFGKPIYVKDLSAEDKKRVGAYVRDIMIEEYRDMKKSYENA